MDTNEVARRRSLILKSVILAPIGGIGGFAGYLSGYLSAHFLYPMIGYWSIAVTIIVGIAIGWFGSKLLHRLGV
jgi:hypothetical protein